MSGGGSSIAELQLQLQIKNTELEVEKARAESKKAEAEKAQAKALRAKEINDILTFGLWAALVAVVIGLTAWFTWQLVGDT